MGLAGKPGQQGKTGETGLPGPQGSFGSKVRKMLVLSLILIGEKVLIFEKQSCSIRYIGHCVA